MRKVIFGLLASGLVAGCVTAKTETTFDAAAAKAALRPGKSTVEGQAFLRQQGGGVVKAAGEDVRLVPATSYARERFQILYGQAKQVKYGKQIENTPEEYITLLRTTKADAEGRFKFDDVASGDYFVQTQVFWRAGNSYVPEGASFYELIHVQEPATVSVILSGN